MIDAELVYPVCFQTEKRRVKSGNSQDTHQDIKVVPKAGPKGGLQPEGFELLLEYIARGE